MKIKWSGIGITEGRGHAGGSVASRNASGAYIRNKVTPVFPNTPAQAAVNAIFADIAQVWRDLTQAQRDAWNEAVSNFEHTDIFSDTITPSGFNLHQQLNLNLASIGLPFIQSPPAPADVQSLTNLSVALDGGGTDLEVNSSEAIEATTDFIIKATVGLSAGISFVKTELKALVIVTDSDAFPINIQIAYDAVFGSLPAVGTKVFVEMIGVNNTTGQRGSGIKADVIIT
jgi:hypothetical protein